MPAELTICVVNYNGGEALPGILRAVYGQEPPPAAVILVDNASSDGSADHARAAFPQVRVLALPVNDGPAAAREAGFRAATTGLVGFVDNDVTPAPDCFARLAAALAANDRAALAMPRVVHAEAPGTVQFDGARALHRAHGARRC